MKRINKLFLVLIIFVCLMLTSSCSYDDMIDDAIRNNDCEYVSNYFTKHPDRINKPLATRKSSKYSTNYPIVEAVISGSSLDMVKLLIDDFGAKVDESYENYTLLMLACKYESDDVIMYLLDKGADLNLFSFVSDASFNNEENEVYFIVSNFATNDYTFSLDVLKHLLENDLLDKEESRFATTLLEPVLIDYMNELDTTSVPEEMIKIAEKYIPILKIVIEYSTINSDYFTDENVKTEWIMIEELLKNFKK